MPMFKGSIAALITPFRDGKVDVQAFHKLVEWQIDQGTARTRALRDDGRIADAHL